MMIKKVEVNSSFLEQYLRESEEIHFLGNGGEASLYININNSDQFKDLNLYSWIEFEQATHAPIMILYVKLNNLDQELLFNFIYDVNEENDLQELNHIIDHSEIGINVMEFEDETLYFAYKYSIELDHDFIEEFKRLIFRAKEYARSISDDYDMDHAIDDFIDGKSIFNSKTKVIDTYTLLYPQAETQEAVDEEEEEEKFFTYTSNTSGDFHDEGDALQVKVYRRDEYERMKKGGSQEKAPKESYEFLKNRIKQLEMIITSKNNEIEQLKTENIHLKEELEYQKLDNPKKGWKLF